MLLFFAPLPLHFDRLICRKSGKFLQFCRIALQNNDLPRYKAKALIVMNMLRIRESDRKISHKSSGMPKRRTKKFSEK